LSESADESTKITNLVTRDLDQALYVGSQFALSGLIPNCGKLVLKPDVGLNDAVVNIARQSLPFLFGNARNQPVKQPNVIKDWLNLLNNLGNKVRVIIGEKAPLRAEKEPPIGLIVQREGH
jgi:hypothetical protein